MATNQTGEVSCNYEGLYLFWPIQIAHNRSSKAQEQELRSYNGLKREKDDVRIGRKVTLPKLEAVARKKEKVKVRAKARRALLPF